MSSLSPRLEKFVAGRPDTPVVAIDLDIVEERYLALAAALPGVSLFYAVKANPAPEILSLLRSLGCRFDVASSGEVALCRDLGAEGHEISFGNTIKHRDAVAAAHELGIARFSVDCSAELDKIHEAAPGSLVSARISCDGAGASWPLSGKFGCSPSDAVELLIRAADLGHRLGVSFHVGSQQLRTGAWDVALIEVAAMADDLARRGLVFDEVNLGGGFPASLGDGAPAIDEYGAAIMSAVEHRIGGLDARLAAEPGRYLVADAGALVSEVLLVSQRSVGDSTRWVYLDVGVFTGLVEAIGEAVRYPITCDRSSEDTLPSILAGPTCDSLDVIYEQHPVALPAELAEGDRLVFAGTGAYTTTYSAVAFNGFAPLRQVVLSDPASSSGS